MPYNEDGGKTETERLQMRNRLSNFIGIPLVIYGKNLSIFGRKELEGISLLLRAGQSSFQRPNLLERFMSCIMAQGKRSLFGLAASALKGQPDAEHPNPINEMFDS
jgi:hypothetical protein